jgi:hypothetical protein
MAAKAKMKVRIRLLQPLEGDWQNPDKSESAAKVYGFSWDRPKLLALLRLQIEFDTRYDFASYLNDSLTFAR